MKLGRRFVGSEIGKEYCEISALRMEYALGEMRKAEQLEIFEVKE